MWSYAAAICLALSIANPALAQSHEHHQHEHGASAAPELATPDGARFATDQALRTGMQQIRAAVATLEGVDSGNPKNSHQVLAQADAIEGQIDYLIANCRLEPQADAVLHGIIGQLLGGTRALRKAPDDTAALAQLQAALSDYAERFDETASID